MATAIQDEDEVLLLLLLVAVITKSIAQARSSTSDHQFELAGNCRPFPFRNQQLSLVEINRVDKCHSTLSQCWTLLLLLLDGYFFAHFGPRAFSLQTACGGGMYCAI